MANIKDFISDFKGVDKWRTNSLRLYHRNDQVTLYTPDNYEYATFKIIEQRKYKNWLGQTVITDTLKDTFTLQTGEQRTIGNTYESDTVDVDKSITLLEYKKADAPEPTTPTPSASDYAADQADSILTWFSENWWIFLAVIVIIVIAIIAIKTLGAKS